MKSIIFTIGILVGAASVAAPALPEGTFKGTAVWEGSGNLSGTYTVEKSFKGDTIRAHYVWSQPQPREETHAMTFRMQKSAPLFDVLDEKNQVVGTGFCMDDTCAYRLTSGPFTVDEAFRWNNGSLVATGSKSGPGFSVVWKETLESQ